MDERQPARSDLHVQGAACCRGQVVVLVLKIVLAWLWLCWLMQDGDRFWKMPECYIRGNTIKYIRVPNEVGKTLY
jgi:hypothetical protein